MEKASVGLDRAEQEIIGMRRGAMTEPDAFQGTMFWLCRVCEITFAHLGRTPPHCPGCGVLAARQGSR